MRLHGIYWEYLKHLAKLALDEDAQPTAFQTVPQLYSVYMGLSERVWEQQIAARYGNLKLVWLQWLAHAASIMQPRLARDDQSDAEV